MTTFTTFEEKIKWLVAEHARAILAAEKAEKEREEALDRAEMIAEIRETMLMRAPSGFKCVFDKAEIKLRNEDLDDPTEGAAIDEEPDADTADADEARETISETQAELDNLAALAAASSRRAREVVKERIRRDPHGPLRAAAAKLPKAQKSNMPDEEAEAADHGKPVDIGNGTREVREGTNFAHCINALRSRAPHWMTPTGAYEVIKNEIRRDIPPGSDTNICELFRSQRTKQMYKVPGLQMRKNGSRVEYRMAFIESPA
jgi:hypothetical protein